MKDKYGKSVHHYHHQALTHSLTLISVTDFNKEYRTDPCNQKSPCVPAPSAIKNPLMDITQCPLVTKNLPMFLPPLPFSNLKTPSDIMILSREVVLFWEGPL